MAKKQSNIKASGGRGGKIDPARAASTIRKIEQLADMVVGSAARKKDPNLDIPIRALSNVRFDPKRAFIEMGDARQARHFFDKSMARKFMQTLLVAAQCKQLIEANKTASIRQLYYLSKHDVAGTKEKTFNDQEESDPIIEDVEVTID